MLPCESQNEDDIRWLHGSLSVIYVSEGKISEKWQHDNFKKRASIPFANLESEKINFTLILKNFSADDYGDYKCISSGQKEICHNKISITETTYKNYLFQDEILPFSYDDSPSNSDHNSIISFSLSASIVNFIINICLFILIYKKFFFRRGSYNLTPSSDA